MQVVQRWEAEGRGQGCAADLTQRCLAPVCPFMLALLHHAGLSVPPSPHASLSVLARPHMHLGLLLTPAPACLPCHAGPSYQPLRVSPSLMHAPHADPLPCSRRQHS